MASAGTRTRGTAAVTYRKRIISSESNHMASQIYSHQDDNDYRVLSKEGNGALIFRRPDYTAGEHEHPEAQVSILFRGASASLLTHSETGKTTRTGVTRESFTYIPPGQPHRLNWSSDGELLNLYISGRSLCEFTEQDGCLLPGLKLADRPDRAVYEIGRLLLDEFQSMGGLAPTMIDHAIFLIARRVLRVTERISQGETSGLLSLKRLQPAIDMVHGNPERNFTLMELARLCNSSVFHFARSFSARTGSAPFRLQRTLRLQKARELLLATDLSVGDVGLAVGVENLAHFSRVFREHFGCSPREYRRLQFTKYH